MKAVWKCDRVVYRICVFHVMVLMNIRWGFPFHILLCGKVSAMWLSIESSMHVSDHENKLTPLFCLWRVRSKIVFAPGADIPCCGSGPCSGVKGRNFKFNFISCLFAQSFHALNSTLESVFKVHNPFKDLFLLFMKVHKGNCSFTSLNLQSIRETDAYLLLRLRFWSLLFKLSKSPIQ